MCALVVSLWFDLLHSLLFGLPPVCPLLPPQRRAAARALQEKHGTPVRVRQQMEWGHLRRPLLYQNYENPRNQRWKRIFLRMDQWSKYTFYQNLDSDPLQCGKLRSHNCSKLIKFVHWILINFTDIHDTKETFLVILFSFIFFTYSKWNSDPRPRRWD